MKKIFAPGNDSGLTMLWHHGVDKLEKFNTLSSGFPDPLGVGHKVSLALTLFAEVVAAALLAAGLLTRFAALVLAFEMGVAFTQIHKMDLGGPMPGEFAFIYLGAYLTLLFAGGGKISLDKVFFGKTKSGWGKKD